MNHSDLYLRFVNSYIDKFHPHINEITSLEEVLVVAYNGYLLFSYGNRGVIAIKERKRRIFGTDAFTVIKDGYTIKGVNGFSNIIGPMLSLTSDEFNGVMMEWLYNKHPEIDSVEKLYEFCKSNYKRYEDVKHLIT